ncbi:hypothetical protein V8G54_007177 [Vigna mungo]|uniref:Uncharacterized protein n=1 Tax=Vigna mungo TaxID=3915 RepID=A0AAQ3P2T5_VIGMU
MQGNKSVVRLKSSRFPLEVNTKTLKYNAQDGTTGFSSETTYSLGDTLVTINITQEICSGRVKAVYIDISEDTGKGSFAKLSMRVTRNKRYGILCNYMNTLFGGSYNSVKENYCAPPLPEREMVHYICGESGCGGCFTLEKKKEEYGAVVRVQVTHDFMVGEETMHMKVKIKNDDKGREEEGLNVEVEGPVKLTRDYMNHVVSGMRKKMLTAIETSTVSLVKNGTVQHSSKDGSREIDSRVKLTMSRVRSYEGKPSNNP